MHLSERKISVLLRGVLVLGIGHAAHSAPRVWIASSMERVAPDVAPRTDSEAQLRAARGETESFQIVIHAPAGGGNLTNVNVEMTDLAGPSENMITRASFSLYREHFVNVNISSPDQGGTNRPLRPGVYPDGLIPFVDADSGQLPLATARLKAVPFTVENGKSQVIWVDVNVPSHAVAGQYVGIYSVTSDQGNVTGQVSLAVWNFTLPLRPSLKSSFQYWLGTNGGSIQELLRHKLMPSYSNPADQRRLIELYGLNSQNVGFWSGADHGNCVMSPPPSVADVQRMAAMHDPRLLLYNYSADEVGKCTHLYPRIRQWAQNLRQGGVKNLITMAPVPELMDDGSGSGQPAVDIWVVLPLMYEESPARVAEAIQRRTEVWSYNALVQDSYSPKWQIDFLPINYRIQPGFINQSLGLTGLLYWRIDLWSSDPWNNVYSLDFSRHPGEGLLVYPGSTVGIQGVAPSMRLKWLRDGVEDYEYVEMLKKAGESAWALQTARGVGADWRTWTRDPAVLENARRQMGERLQALNGGPGAGPAQPGFPKPPNGVSGVPASPVLSWSAVSGAASYDVYFGTIPLSALAAQVTTPSFTPPALQPNTTYYWRIVSRTAAGTASSPIWQFTTTSLTSPIPETFSVSPASASGLQQTFQLNYTLPEGLVSSTVLINEIYEGRAACWIHFDNSSRTLSLADDSTANWNSSELGAGPLLQNSQCSLAVAQASVSTSDSTTTLSLPISFKPGFSGVKHIHIRFEEPNGLVSGYFVAGSFTVSSN